MSTQDPLSDAQEALRQAQSDLYNANAYFSGAKIEPILARLDAIPAPIRLTPRGAGWRFSDGWFYPDAPLAREDDVVEEIHNAMCSEDALARDDGER